MKYERMSDKIGQILSSNNFGDFEVIETLPKRKTLVKFLNTGAIAQFDNSNILRGVIKDPSVCNKIYGWGINDADYAVYETCRVNGKVSITKVCPVYSDWTGILERGCCPKYKENFPTYKDVKVSDDWRYFSNFREWVLNIQPNKKWQSCVPDKDVIYRDNKVYSPSSVVYVCHTINNFTISRKNGRGEYMIGVSIVPSGRFRSAISDPFTNRSEYIGTFDTELEAHKAWQAKKH